MIACLQIAKDQRTVFEPNARLATERKSEMRALAIVPRDNREIGMELHDSITCPREAGFDPRDAVAGPACALIWVDDQQILASVETLRSAGLQAIALTETDEPW